MSSVTCTMDGVIFDWERPNLSIEDTPVSHHPNFDIATNPASTHSFLRGLSATDDPFVDHRTGPLDISPPPHTHNLQVNTETYPSPPSLPPLIQVTHNHDVDEGARTLHPENDVASISYESSLVAHSPMFHSALSSFAHTQTSTNSNEVPLVISNDSLTYTYIDHGDVDTTFDYLQEGESMNVSSVQQFNTTSPSLKLEPSIPPGIACASVIQGPDASASRYPRRPAGTRAARNGPYSCNVCGKQYTQQQGLWRHHREKHNPGLCDYCGIFRWGRPYLYKRHLQKKHGVNLDAALDEATDAGRM